MNGYLTILEGPLKMFVLALDSLSAGPRPGAISGDRPNMNSLTYQYCPTPVPSKVAVTHQPTPHTGFSFLLLTLNGMPKTTLKHRRILPAIGRAFPKDNVKLRDRHLGKGVSCACI